MAEHIILGYSGHAYVVLDAAKQAGLSVLGYTEKQEQVLNPYALHYLGFEGSHDFEYWNKGYKFIPGMGGNMIRARISDLLTSKDEQMQSVMHPKAIIASQVTIDEGTFIAAGAMINPLVHIGKAVIINTGAIVEHECSIGDFSHVAPGAVLAGNVHVGRSSFIGANAVIKEGVRIGDGAVVGAGSVVLKDVGDNHKIVGNPGKVL